MATNNEHQSQNTAGDAPRHHHDCAITRPDQPIAIPILSNDERTQEVPRLLIEDHPAGELWFREGGEAVYQPPDEGTAIVSFRYGAGAEPEGSATVFVLVNGEDDLPAGSLRNDEALKACSQATALDTLKHDVLGEPVPAPQAGVRVDVPVDAFAGQEIVLTNDDFGDAKYLEGDGGILFFLRDGRLVFLAGADQTDVKVPPKYLVLDEIWDPVSRTAADVLEYAKGEWTKLPPPEARAELAANHQAFLTATAGEASTEALARTELPFCRTAECQVYEYQGDGYVRVGSSSQLEAGWHAPGLDDLWIAGGVDWLAHGSRPAVMLAAVGTTDGLGSDLSPLGAYWLERDPGARVIRLDDFFARAGEVDPPDLSIAESHFVAADDLLRIAQPVTLPGFVAEDIVRWIPSSAFTPRDEGGTRFRSYGQGGIGEGPSPILAQEPTALVPRELTPGPDTGPPPQGGNLDPVANDDVATTSSDQPITLSPLANDFDPDGDPIVVARVLGLLENGTPSGAPESVDGRTIMYTPGTLFATTSGTATIRYTIRDDRGAESEPATITVAVALNNEPPVALDDGAVTRVDQPVTIDVLENDKDQDDIPNGLLGDSGKIPLTIPIKSIVQPEHGTVVRIGPRGEQQLTYEPDKNFEGTDSFTYQAFDGLSRSNGAEVTVQVIGDPPPNQPPVARPDDGLAQVGGPPITIDVLDNDSDPDGDALQIVRVGDPDDDPLVDETALGARVEVVGGHIVYTPPPDPEQPGRIDDTFTYAITDGHPATLPVETQVTVTLIDDGEPVPPKLTVLPSFVEIEYVADRRFDAEPLFPDLAERRPVADPNGVDSDSLTLDTTRDVSVTFVSEVASFQNSLGWYVLGKDASGMDVPLQPKILFENLDGLQDGTEGHLGSLSAGTQIGFFLVQDGFDLNDGVLDPEGEFEFRDEGGTWELFRVDGGSERAVLGTILHSVTGLNTELPPQTDSTKQIQAISGRNDEGDALVIGFEDLDRSDPKEGADDDFNDAVFQVSYGPAAPPLPGLDLTATIDDPDSPFMTHASVKSSQNGDQLILRPDDILDGSGIVLAGEGTDELVFDGDAPIADYEEALGAVELAAGSTGRRELTFEVFDDTNLGNQPEVRVEVVTPAPVAVGDLVTAGALLASLVPDQPIAG